MKVYEALARAFSDEGTEVVFGLMGDGNMDWMAVLEEHGVDIVHARHEGAALTMADGSARATGRVGVATVTCGPGLTQLGTSLTASTRHGTPIVVFAGDTPSGAAFNLQEFDQKPFVEATGARFLRSHGPDEVADDVQMAFAIARRDRIPVVLSAPLDTQAKSYDWPWTYVPSSQLIPHNRPLLPNPDDVSELARLLDEAERPVLIGGRGAVAADARDALVALAERTGALLATTVRAKGLFDGVVGNAGMAGAFSFPAAREQFASADLVVGFGARMGHFTTEGGYLFPEAHHVQVDLEPIGYHEGLWVAQTYVRGDARLTAEAVTDKVVGGPTGYRTPDVLASLAADKFDEPPYDLSPETVDPRAAVAELSDALPPEWLVIVGAGHFWNFVVSGFSGRPPTSYEFTYDFGVVGQGLPTGIGAARGLAPNRPVALIEGDGSLLMNLQEIESLGRHRIPLLAFIINDGAYGAEVHKLVAKGLPAGEAVFYAPDFGAIAAALGVRAETVTDDGQIAGIVARFAESPEPTIVDIRVSPNVVCAQYRRLFFGAT